MTKILMIYIWYTGGGVETAIKNRLKYLDTTKYSVDILFLQKEKVAEATKKFKETVYFIDDFKKIRNLINKNNYDVIISIDTPQVFKLIADINFKGVFGLECHTTYPDSLTYLKSVDRNLVSFIIVPSERQKALISRLISSDIPIHAIPNSVDLDIFKCYEFPSCHERPIFAWIGRLDKHKRWEYYLNVAQNIQKIRPDQQEFWMVGGLESDPSEIKRFRKYILNSNLTSCFKWLPYVPYSKMGKLYSYVAESKGACISTSVNESFGMTIIEAVCCKCPVIYPMGIKFDETLVGKNNIGWNIDMNHFNYKKIADEVVEWISDDEKRNQETENAFEIVTKKFDNKANVKKFEKFIDVVTANHKY